MTDEIGNLKGRILIAIVKYMEISVLLETRSSPKETPVLTFPERKELCNQTRNMDLSFILNMFVKMAEPSGQCVVHYLRPEGETL